MVSEEVKVYDGAFQRVAIFKFRVATGNLANVTPGWSGISHQWVIHPLRHFMRGGSYVVYLPEFGVSARVEVHYRVGLRGIADRRSLLTFF